MVTLATTKQQKSVGGLTSRVRVRAKFTGVKPPDADLMTITRARESSGIPCAPSIAEKKLPSLAYRTPIEFELAYESPSIPA